MAASASHSPAPEHYTGPDPLSVGLFIQANLNIIIKVSLAHGILTSRFLQRVTHETGSDSQAKLVPTSTTRQPPTPIWSQLTSLCALCSQQTNETLTKHWSQKKPVSLETSPNESEIKKLRMHLQLICVGNGKAFGGVSEQSVNEKQKELVKERKEEKKYQWTRFSTPGTIQLMNKQQQFSFQRDKRLPALSWMGAVWKQEHGRIMGNHRRKLREVNPIIIETLAAGRLWLWSSHTHSSHSASSKQIQQEIQRLS